MKAYFQNMNEAAEFVINNEKFDDKDVIILIQEVCKKYAEKNGIEKAKEISMPFQKDRAKLFTVEGLTSFLNAMEVKLVSWIDVLTGNFTYERYVSL